MWLPTRAFELFRISQDAFKALNEEVSSLKAERDALKNELATTKANFEWIRLRINALEMERAQLIDRAYGLKVSVPEITRTPAMQMELGSDIFEDMGDDKARSLGLPVWDAKK